ncbi:MAG: PHB depolymerase family esterase [Syntrophales bacterium]
MSDTVKAIVISFAAIITMLLMGISVKSEAVGILQGTYGSRSGDFDYTLVHDGMTRKYRVHLPPNYNQNISLPAVMYLHGGGGNLSDSEKNHMLYFSDKLGFILISPEGTGTVKTWNAGKWDNDEYGCCGWALSHKIDDVRFLSEVIDAVERGFNVDSKRIYVVGMSNGGMMTYRVACELSDKFAAAAAVAAHAVESGCMPSRPVPVMHVHGTDDRVCLTTAAPHMVVPALSLSLMLCLLQNK